MFLLIMYIIEKIVSVLHVDLHYVILGAFVMGIVT